MTITKNNSYDNANLTKSEVVLDHDEPGVGDIVMFFNDDNTHALGLPRIDWQDMGEPRQVTLTIVPGNTLEGLA